MTGENTPSVIRALAIQLGEMAERAASAEAEAAEARKSSEEWYQHWQHKDAELKEAQEKLAAEIADHQNTRKALREALDTAKAKGAQDNG